MLAHFFDVENKTKFEVLKMFFPNILREALQ